MSSIIRIQDLPAKEIAALLAKDGNDVSPMLSAARNADLRPVIDGRTNWFAKLFAIASSIPMHRPKSLLKNFNRLGLSSASGE